MIEHTEAISVTPDAWHDLYAIFRPLLIGMSEWGEKHNMPLAVAVGALYGVSEVMHRAGNGCDCDICVAVSDAVAEEVIDRMLEPMLAVRH